MNVITDREAVIGATVADATIILAAVDPCYCCTERMSVRDADTGCRLMGWRDLLRRSRERTDELKRILGAEGPKLDLGLLN
jgi:NADH-quinone oxidoreductase subunit D